MAVLESSTFLPILICLRRKVASLQSMPTLNLFPDILYVDKKPQRPDPCQRVFLYAQSQTGRQNCQTDHEWEPIGKNDCYGRWEEYSNGRQPFIRSNACGFIPVDTERRKAAGGENNLPWQKNPMTHQVILLGIIILSFVVVFLNSKQAKRFILSFGGLVEETSGGTRRNAPGPAAFSFLFSTGN